MRKLAWAALPYAAAVFLAEYLLPIKGLPYIAAALFLLGFGALLLGKKRRVRLALVLFSAAVGLGWFSLHNAVFIAPCVDREEQTVYVQVRLCDWPRCDADAGSAEVRITGGDLPRVRAKLYGFQGELSGLEPGDEISCYIYVAEDTDALDYRDIFLRGYIQGNMEYRGRWSGAWLYFPQRLCHGIKNSCDRVFIAEAAPLVKAMMTGDKDDLQAQQANYTAVKSCGMAHIVAVSGMHMMFLVTALQMLLGRGRRSSLICLPLVLLFVLMTGASPSIVRAAVITSLFLLAPLFNRESDAVTSLSAALLLLLLLNPTAADSLSLQLSFAAAAGLVLLCPPINRWIDKNFRKKWMKAIGNSFSCTLGASVFSLPLAAAHFGYVPLLSALVNLLTLWIMEFIFCSGYVLSLLGLLLPGLCSVLGWITDGAAVLCLGFYRLLARLPFVCVYTNNVLVVLWLVLVYGLFLLTFLGRRRGKQWRYIIPSALSVSALCVVLIVSGLFGLGKCGVTVLDVGQGESVLLYDNAATVLVDCGGKNSYTNAGDTAADFVYGSGRRQIDLLILTHLHADHTNGVTELLNRIPVRYMAFSEECFDDDLMLTELLAAAEECGTTLLPIEEESALTLGNIALELYLPLSGESENERGIVVAAEIRDTDILITGDMDDDGELILTKEGRADTDILVAGHHGSKYSSNELFLMAASPEWSIVSVGENNYGHPTEQTMERLYAYSDNVYRTDEDGNVTIRIR